MAPRWWAVAHRVAYTTRVASSSSWIPSGTETVLYTFDYHNPTPGDGPEAGVILDSGREHIRHYLFWAATIPIARQGLRSGLQDHAVTGSRRRMTPPVNGPA